jgi:hypothetical protein
VPITVEINGDQVILKMPSKLLKVARLDGKEVIYAVAVDGALQLWSGSNRVMMPPLDMGAFIAVD